VYAINSKVFLADFYFCGVFLDLDKYIFYWQTCVIWGGRLRLELSCIQVSMVWSSYASCFVIGQFR